MYRAERAPGRGGDVVNDPHLALIDAWFDGVLDERDVRTLETWLCASPEHADLFARKAYIHARTYAILNCRDVGRIRGSFSADDPHLDSVLRELEQANERGAGHPVYDEESTQLLMEALGLEREAAARRAEREAAEQARSEKERQLRSQSFDHLLGREPEVTPVRHIVIPRPLAYAAVAAILLLTLALFWPNRTASVAPAPTAPVVEAQPIATLVEAIDAVWSSSANGVDIRTGERLMPGQLHLRSGLARLRLGSEAEVVLEGPVSIELLEENYVRLQQGRMVGLCPTVRSRGFRVQTPTAEIIDHGTEFGVHVEPTGATSVVVFDGLVELRGTASSGQHATDRLMLGAHWAGRVNEAGELLPAMEPIESIGVTFARRVERRLNVADFVGGGDGTGTGRLYAAIDFTNGTLIDRPRARTKVGDGRYTLVSDAPFVDGVFIPDGGRGPVQINSRGDQVHGLRDTRGTAWLEISNGGVYGQSTGNLHHPRLGGIEYGTAETPSINLHSNGGITFDLNAVRAAHPTLKITRFVALAGLSETATAETEPHVDLIVMLDNRLVFRVDSVPRGEYHEVSVPISSNDRFLTLIVTDGGDTASSDATAADFALFGRPELVLEP